MTRSAPFVATLVFACLTGLSAAAQDEITREEILAAQKGWGDALVAISIAHDEQGSDAAEELAQTAVLRLYAHEDGPVLFKPTLASAPHRFRTTQEGALSYFIGGNPAFPNDTGFAYKGWREVAVDNAAIFIDGRVGMTMGDVTFTNAAGVAVSVDKTWGFRKTDDGTVVIVLHHSSLPYTE